MDTVKVLDKKTATANYELCRTALGKVGMSRLMLELEGRDDPICEEENNKHPSNLSFFISRSVTDSYNLSHSRLCQSKGENHYDISMLETFLNESITQARQYVECAHPELKEPARSLLELCEAAAIIAISDSIDSLVYQESARKIDGGKGRRQFER